VTEGTEIKNVKLAEARSNNQFEGETKKAREREIELLIREIRVLQVENSLGRNNY